jgi:hypothetical protein
MVTYPTPETVIVRCAVWPGTVKPRTIEVIVRLEGSLVVVLLVETVPFGQKVKVMGELTATSPWENGIAPPTLP